jgi:hypothetical protein
MHQLDQGDLKQCSALNEKGPLKTHFRVAFFLANVKEAAHRYLQVDG